MWEGLYCFLLFSCGDWAGRLLAGALAGCGARFFESGAILKLLILSRLLLMLLLILAMRSAVVCERRSYRSEHQEYY